MKRVVRYLVLLSAGLLLVSGCGPGEELPAGSEATDRITTAGEIAGTWGEKARRTNGMTPTAPCASC